ncbi:MAG: hypothetical protein LBS31_07020 [Candidatus Adiutrix sp.]|jgi:BirA family biotin operon repressor/biotin-[acetyl-CoA-carboxylase] ligase|nr:hypothetical protein [Candidatus Adiutrix sp.]
MTTREPALIAAGDPPGEYPVYFYEKTTSSLDAAWRLIEEGALPIWGSTLARRQTAGRGRMGRVWQSPPGHVYGAIRLPAARPFDGPGASLALAFVLSEALNGFGEFLIKWPNDLIYGGGKAGGLLLESRGATLTAGIGLNLVAPPAGEWVGRREPGAPPPSALPASETPEELWSGLVKKIILLYDKKFGAMGMEELSRLAERRLLWRGLNVIIRQPATEPAQTGAGPLRGRIAGLCPAGSLLIHSGQREYRVWSGSVCLDYFQN